MDIKDSFYSYFPSLAVQNEPPKPPPPSVDWERIAKIALVGAGAIAIGVTAYYLYNELSALNNDLHSLDNNDLIKALKPVCRDAVENYCKPGPNGQEVCLKDYLIENWQPVLSVEHNHDILCPVDLQSTDCSILARQPTVQEWIKRGDGTPYPFVFVENYEHIATKIPEHFSTKFRRAINHFQGYEKDVVGFKSHIFCRS